MHNNDNNNDNATLWLFRSWPHFEGDDLIAFDCYLHSSTIQQCNVSLGGPTSLYNILEGLLKLSHCLFLIWLNCHINVHHLIGWWMITPATETTMITLLTLKIPALSFTFPWHGGNLTRTKTTLSRCLACSLKRSELKELEKPYHIEMKILHGFHATPVNIYIIYINIVWGLSKPGYGPSLSTVAKFRQGPRCSTRGIVLVLLCNKYLMEIVANVFDTVFFGWNQRNFRSPLSPNFSAQFTGSKPKA